MVLYCRMERWELWNNYDWYHPTAGSKPIHTSLWYYEDEIKGPPFEAKRHQEWHKGVSYMKYEER